ncbi:hypothetical protein GALL_259440 [mine drainage metagenome]|uniref:DUF4224 domain-containing protein n=1 Tax=mine drainage metagenome TaxID=410659 RepID=A0A1J5RRI7_9ZZZZ
MTTPKSESPAAIENEARVRANGINLASDYGRWVLKVARESKIYMCLAHKGDGFLCIQAGDGAGHRCRLHGGASRGPKTEEGKARSAANLRQNRMRGPIRWRAEPAGEVPAQPTSAMPEGQALGEYLSREEVATLTGKKRGGAQCVVLRELGIPFLARRGVPIVSRVLVQQTMSGSGGAP